MVFIITGIISSNHNQPGIFSLSAQGRLFSLCPGGCVVILLVFVCEREWVYLCLCVCARVQRYSKQQFSRGKISAMNRVYGELLPRAIPALLKIRGKTDRLIMARLT